MTTPTGETLRGYNTLALDARAQAFAEVHSEQELLAALAQARALGLPVMPLGEGSNIVLAGSVAALVIRLGTRGIEVLARDAGTVSLRVAAGESWHGLVRWTLQQGYYGLENLALIPGTVGAAPIQNIGAYGVELASCVQRVNALQIGSDERLALSHQQCEFGYRDSVFKHRLRDKVVITSIDPQLSLRPAVSVEYPALAGYFEQHGITEPTPEAVFDAVVKIRRSRLPDPAVIPNAGSFFKNPIVEQTEAQRLQQVYPELPSYPQHDGRVKLSAAWMIDRCGWKGVRRGGVGVHAHHALVLVNYGSDSGAELLALASDIVSSVQGAFGVRLEIEPRVYGAGA